MPTDVRVTIYDRNIDRLFLNGGDAWNWMERLGREHLGMALIEAPSRTGLLRAQHNLALTPYNRGVRYSVGNYADYAHFVHEGTAENGAGYIIPYGWDDGHPPWLAVRPAPHSRFPGPGPTYVREVHGQRANPWIRNAGNIVLSRYGVTASDIGYPA